MVRVRGTRLRSQLWACLRTDDGDGLVRTLHAHDIRTLPKLDGLRMKLWKDNMGKGGARYGAGVPTSLITTAATNRAGLPPHGAPSCMLALLNSYGPDAWPAEERGRACERIRDMGRAAVRQLLSERQLWVDLQQ